MRFWVLKTDDTHYIRNLNRDIGTYDTTNTVMEADWTVFEHGFDDVLKACPEFRLVGFTIYEDKDTAEDLDSRLKDTVDRWYGKLWPEFIIGQDTSTRYAYKGLSDIRETGHILLRLEPTQVDETAAFLASELMDMAQRCGVTTTFEKCMSCVSRIQDVDEVRRKFPEFIIELSKE